MTMLLFSKPVKYNYCVLSKSHFQQQVVWNILRYNWKSSQSLKLDLFFTNEKFTRASSP